MRLSQVQESKPNLKLAPTDTVVLADLSKQLQSKADLFQDIDGKILTAIDNEDKIEEAVFNRLFLKASLAAKIALILHTLATSSHTSTSPAAPTQTDKGTITLPSSNSPIITGTSGSQETQQYLDLLLIQITCVLPIVIMYISPWQIPITVVTQLVKHNLNCMTSHIMLIDSLLFASLN